MSNHLPPLIPQTGEARLLDMLLLDCIQITDDRALVCRHCERGIAASEKKPIPHESGCVVGQIQEIRASRRSAGSAQAPETPPVCEWTFIDEEGSQYDTTCGQSFSPWDGEPPDYIKFCCYCGKQTRIVAASSSDEQAEGQR